MPLRAVKTLLHPIKQGKIINRKNTEIQDMKQNTR
jgi:hypothetical protein